MRSGVLLVVALSFLPEAQTITIFTPYVQKDEAWHAHANLDPEKIGEIYEYFEKMPTKTLPEEWKSLQTNNPFDAVDKETPNVGVQKAHKWEAMFDVFEHTDAVITSNSSFGCTSPQMRHACTQLGRACCKDRAGDGSTCMMKGSLCKNDASATVSCCACSRGTDMGSDLFVMHNAKTCSIECCRKANRDYQIVKPEPPSTCSARTHGTIDCD